MAKTKEALDKAQWTSDVTDVKVTDLLTPSTSAPTLKPPVILWDDPDPAQALDGSLVLDDTHLNARITPGAGTLTYKPAKGTSLAPGKHKLEVSSAANERYEAATKVVSLTVRKARVKLQWTAPTAVDFTSGGVALTDTQLNATSTPSGCVLQYEPAKGTLLNAGTHVLKAKPAQADHYEDTQAQVQWQIRKARPVLSWHEPASVTATAASTGATPTFTLTDTELSATRTTGESPLVFSPAKGAAIGVGTTLLRVSHAESANYTYGEAFVRLVVCASAKIQEGYEALRGGGGFSTTTPLDPKIQKAWDDDTDNIKTDAKRIMQAAQDMTGPELIDFMNAQVKDKSTQYKLNDKNKKGNPATYPNHIWILPNGLQIRYKPNGDIHVNKTGKTPVPMFCVEVRKPTQTGFGEDQADVATKISVDGELSPKGPGETDKPGGTKDEVQEYLQGSCGATHLHCRQGKVPQVIECPTTITMGHGTPLSPELLGIRLQPGDGAITLNPVAGTLLPVGAGQSVTIKAAETSRHSEATKVVSVSVTKGQARIVWDHPDDMICIAGGVPLSDTQLNARLEPSSAGTITYTPVKGSKLEPGQHTLKAQLAGSSTQDAATAEVTVTVLKGAPTITWADPAEVQAAGEGFVLSATQLNAQVDPLSLPLVYTPALGERLDPGTHTLHVHTAGNAQFKSQVKQVRLTVRAPGK